MKKQTTIITLGILMLAGVMAMYSGESMTFKTNLSNPVYTVSGNTSSLEGLTVEFENGNITITFSVEDPKDGTYWMEVNQGEGFYFVWRMYKPDLNNLPKGYCE